MPKHSVLIVGCGSIGERHLRCFLQCGRAEVTACDTNAPLLQNMVKEYGVSACEDWKRAINSGTFDAAVICTPAPLHISMGLCALNAGVHVLIEKPLSHSLEGVTELLHALDQSRGQAAVAYVFAVFPFLVAARAFLQQGELGPIRHANVISGQPFNRLRPGYAKTYYRDRNTGGGAIQDALTHSANWMESILGPTESVLCDCAHLVLPDVTVEDTVQVSARHGSALVSYTLNQFQAPNETTIQFHTARGSVKIEFHRQRWGVFREGETEWTWHETPVPDRDTHFTAQAIAFLDQIEGKPARLCSLKAAAQTLRFNLAALASAEKSGRVFCRDLHA